MVLGLLEPREIGKNLEGREMRTNRCLTVCLEVYYTIALALCVCGMTAKRNCDLQCLEMSSAVDSPAVRHVMICNINHSSIAAAVLHLSRDNCFSKSKHTYLVIYLYSEEPIDQPSQSNVANASSSPSESEIGSKCCYKTLFSLQPNGCRSSTKDKSSRLTG